MGNKKRQDKSHILRLNQPRSKRHSGQTLTEFAILIPILVILMVAIVDFGRILMIQHVITNAAREGARAASLGESSSQVYARVRSYIERGSLDPSEADIDVSGAGTAVTGTASTVSVSYPIDSIVLKYVPGATSHFTLSSTSEMIHE
jgi:Flp pilus assembly protein TadG